MKKIFNIFIFFILHIYSKEIVIFVQPFKIFTFINDEYFPAIQNNKLIGLNKITQNSLCKNGYKEVFLRFIEQYNIYFKNNNTSFFTFNHIGSIFPFRLKNNSSKKLLNAIIKYKNDNPNDKIILIGYSHGGNVVLNMANLLIKHNLKIDLVLLLGTPINTSSNKNTFAKLVNGNYVFSNIINIYSLADYLQKIEIWSNNFKFYQKELQPRESLINYPINDFGHVNLWYKVWRFDPFILQVPKILSKFAH